MKKSELVSAINSYATARATGDVNLVQMAAQLLDGALSQLEFEPEEGTETQQEPEPAEAA